MRATYRVRGLKELLNATDRANKETKKYVRTEVGQAAEPIRAEGQRLFTTVDAESAAAFKVSVRRVGQVLVQQSKRKTTGLRPDYGALQMRDALLPALESKENEVVGRITQAVDRIADRLGGN